MSRISTGTGDDGTTGLVGGARVPKSSRRVGAYGAVDEACASVGVAAAHVTGDDVRALLARIESDLFVVGADLASRASAKDAMRVTDADVERIAAETERFERELPPLRRFVLPGGTPAAAFLHHARCVVRRAERDAWALAEDEDDVNGLALVYLNRLSDLLFLLARSENVRAGHAETEWRGKQGT